MEKFADRMEGETIMSLLENLSTRFIPVGTREPALQKIIMRQITSIPFSYIKKEQTANTSTVSHELTCRVSIGKSEIHCEPWKAQPLPRTC